MSSGVSLFPLWPGPRRAGAWCWEAWEVGFGCWGGICIFYQIHVEAPHLVTLSLETAVPPEAAPLMALKAARLRLENMNDRQAQPLAGQALRLRGSRESGVWRAGSAPAQKGESGLSENCTRLSLSEKVEQP